MVNNVVIAASIVFVFGIQYYCVEHLPLIDFRAYKVGNDIRAQMTLPPGAKRDSIVTQLIYKDKKTGEEAGYTMANLPWADTTWMKNHEFVKQDNKVIREGDKPKIKDFKVWDDNNVDMTGLVLDTPGYKIWVAVWDVNKSSKDGFKKVSNLANECAKNGMKVYGLTSSPYNVIDPYRHEANAAFPFYYADGTVIKTMIRSNPGIMLLNGSKVLDMWHHNDTPTLDEVKKYLNK